MGLLRIARTPLVTVGLQATVMEAVRIMDQESIGAVAVTDGDVLAGIFSTAGVLIAWAVMPRTEDAGRATESPPLLEFRPVLANRDAVVLIVGYAAAIWGSVGLRQDRCLSDVLRSGPG